ncbi:MAG TPA: prolyl oligopeptidase family serine peptidase [Anaerolineales bacterium]|nr:prolyl oligopeptidase family serine peptidase [Anaerolineales bacterium]
MTDDFLNQLLNLPTVLYASLSPDRRWVVFVWYHMHENFDVFVVPTDGSRAPIPLTHTPEATFPVSWTPDSKAVIVKEDHDGDELTTLYRVDLDNPGGMVPLTEDRPPFFLRGGSLHPNGQDLFYGANYNFETQSPQDATWVYRHDLTTGKRQPLAKLAKPAYLTPILNRPGTRLIYGAKERHPAGRQYHLIDLQTGEDTEILNFGDPVKVSAVWLADGERIAFLAEANASGPVDYQCLGLYDCRTEAITWLIDDPDRNLEGLRGTPCSALMVHEISQANRRPSWINPDTGIEAFFPPVPGNLMPLGRNTQGDWIALYYAADAPAELVRFSDDASSPDEFISLTDVWARTQLTKDQLTPAESVTWASSDGMDIQGWLYRAQPNNKQAVLYIHGGPTSHSENKLNPQIQYFVSQGFNVLDVNYRGSTGFGLPYREAIKEDGWGGREQDDIAAGAQWLIDHGLAAPGKVGITGTSYGGYSAWCQITHTSPEIIGASAPICGMTDLVVDYNTTRPDLRPYSEEMIGGTPEEIPEKYYQRSPINFVDQIKGQLLIVQGGKDPNVTPENMREVVKRLALEDIPYDLEIFEDEGHGIYKQANQARLYSRLAAFFKQAFGKNETPT